MPTFDVHTKHSAPTDSAPLLASAEKAYGFTPNLLATFAESPATLKAYMTLGKVFDESSFTPTELQTILLTISRNNECRYCIAAHSTVAGMQGVPADVIDAIRDDRPIADERLEPLRQFTAKLVEKRGWLSETEVDDFIDAGFSRAQVFEVILGIGLKTISNYINHIADTPLDNAFAPRQWQPPFEREAG